MGLDMMLYKRKKSKESIRDYIDRVDYGEWNIKEVAYWRKANQIHKWFVDNVQDGDDDCEYYLVTKTNIEDLLDICKMIKDKVKTEKGKIHNGSKLENGEWIDVYIDGTVISNPEVCEELLPTQSGFFFGCTDYDEYYLQDIDNTIEQLEDILNTTNFDEDELYYHSSW